MAEQTLETEVTEKKSSKKLLWIIVSLVVLGVGAGAGWYFGVHHDKKEEHSEENKAEEHKAEESTPPVFVDLEAFTVNIQPDNQFLQTTFSLQISDEKEAEKIKLYMPQIRSSILLLLSAETTEHLSKQEGKTALIDKIKKLLEQPLAKGMTPLKITNVYVTSFIIQ